MNPRTPIEPLAPARIQEAKTAYLSLCRRYLEEHPNGPYADYIGSAAANEAVLDRHVRAFELYAPYLADGMRVLDWGCRQAPDSCMLKTVFPHLRISGCDTMGDDFSIFHRYAGLQFTRLDHEIRLPYPDAEFDAVISGGVLEHVAFEHESLLEVWRTLKMGGLFIIIFLPNRTSVTENLLRLLGREEGHNRTYGLSATRNMLLRRGFALEASGYHQVFPTLGKSTSTGGVKAAITKATVPLNRPAERVPGLRAIASNLYFVVRKVNCL